LGKYAVSNGLDNCISSDSYSSSRLLQRIPM